MSPRSAVTDVFSFGEFFINNQGGVLGFSGISMFREVKIKTGRTPAENYDNRQPESLRGDVQEGGNSGQMSSVVGSERQDFMHTVYLPSPDLPMAIGRYGDRAVM
jgi:hypothetical protein